MQDVVNTTTETTVFTTTIAANDLGTNRSLRLVLVGDYLNNTGSQESFTLRVKYGGATLFTTNPTEAADANRRGFRLEFVLSAGNSASVQYASGSLDIGNVNTVGGNAGATAQTRRLTSIHNAGTVDSTSAQTFEVTYQHGNTGANLSAKMWFANLELLSVG